MQLIPASHHATFDPTTNLFVNGRNEYLIPASAAGGVLTFVCSVNGHCDSGEAGKERNLGGQQLKVNVGTTPAEVDPGRFDGACPKKYTLCPDPSKQTDTTAKVATKVNVPWLNPIAADLLKLGGVATRASTPWKDWKVRPRKRAVKFFGWVFFLISSGSPHVRHMGRTCGEPEEIESTAMGVKLNGSRCRCGGWRARCAGGGSRTRGPASVPPTQAVSTMATAPRGISPSTRSARSSRPARPTTPSTGSRAV